MNSKTPSLILATPCYGGMIHLIYMQSLLALQSACEARGLALQSDLGGGEALISRARAGMMARFLASDASHLLFADADVGFTPDDVFRLLDAGRDVVGGFYPKKRVDAAVLNRGEPLSAATTLEARPLSDGYGAGLHRVAALGTGFLLVSRGAAQRMTESYAHLRAGLGDVAGSQVKDAVMVFDSFIEPETGRYLSDYEAFCRRWRDLGGEVWADAAVRVSHLAEIAVRA
ncbi:hypothetical protein [Phenylobacterium sp.]|uniref:hypothetical protein n=1 Tax=Phenylobacterium sp. TaxID=1871053 RepID=UPI0025CCCC40|nr:hypothetical protein [Phenylobacterium sp.]